MYDLSQEDDRKIVVFGTGLDAVKCVYGLQRKGKEIAYCLNNHRKVELFCGYQVYEPDEEKIRNVFICVAVRSEVYPTVSSQLQNYGLMQFEDYVYYEWTFKNLVLLHGNCHMAIIQSFLLSSEFFRSCYSIYPNPPICMNDKGKVEESVLENCDVWIHEDIRDNNEFGFFLSDEYMRMFIKRDAIDLTIPHLFGLGKAFFPQSEWNKRNQQIKNGEDKNGMFPHADRIIDRCVAQGMDKKDIMEFCVGEDAISVHEIEENFNTYIHKMREREEKWDIKIVDYILKHYKEKKLFYDMGHPTNEILRKISLELLERLGIEDRNINTVDCLDMHEEPVYPVVKKALGMKWDDGYIRKGVLGKKAGSKMDFRVYIEEYLWWCFGMN